MANEEKIDAKNLVKCTVEKDIPPKMFPIGHMIDMQKGWKTV